MSLFSHLIARTRLRVDGEHLKPTINHSSRSAYTNKLYSARSAISFAATLLCVYEERSSGFDQSWTMDESWDGE